MGDTKENASLVPIRCPTLEMSGSLCLRHIVTLIWASYLKGDFTTLNSKATSGTVTHRVMGIFLFVDRLLWVYLGEM